MPFRRSVPSLIVAAGVAWSASGLPLRPTEALAHWFSFSTPRLAVISELQEGEELTARFRSSGCYHWITGRLTFRRSNDLAIEVRVFAHDGLLTDLGMVRRELTDFEVAALDDVLDLYRHRGSSGGCTTEEALAFSLYRRGRYVGHERVVDSGCLFLSHPVPFSFDHLIAEALEASVW